MSGAIQVLQRKDKPIYHEACYVREVGDIVLGILEMPTSPSCSACGEQIAIGRDTNPLGLLCVECWRVCVLSQDKKRWLCPACDFVASDKLERKD